MTLSAEQKETDEKFIERFQLMGEIKSHRMKLQVTRQSRYTPIFKAITIVNIETQIDSLMEKYDAFPVDYFKNNNPSFVPATFL